MGKSTFYAVFSPHCDHACILHFQMYMTSVLWSDQNDIVVYRTFQEFEKLHKQMKKAFPAASKLNKSDRIIPKFQGRKAKQGGRKKGPTKSLVRLKLLQNYCNELLSCGLPVLQSADLIQFFHPKDQDLQPEFSRKGVIIMPSADDLKDTQHSVTGNVTQPFVTETYRCVAPYETKDTKNKPFKVALDEKVDVLIKDKGGWWLVENEDKRMSWFPAPYLEKLEDDYDEDDTDGTPETGSMHTAIKNYKATKGDEISVNMGAMVEVLQKSDNGWWLIRYNGKVGYVPTMYLQPHNYPHIRMPAHHQDRPASSLHLTPTMTLRQSHQLSHSQGNLPQLPPSRSPSPRLLQPEAKERSRSLNILSSDQAPPQQPQISYAVNTATRSANVKHTPPPTIMVEMERAESETSFDSSSSEFSFTDDLSSSSASSTFNLSPSTNGEPLHLSRTPPPTASNYLSPTNGPMGRINPSVSDPNLYKGATTPKIPPRPQQREILSRCTTITRKNASRGGSSPTPPGILSQ
ncbi:NADPH oxidase organizer 1-like [Solea senegalensis]|uniref:NADPH oxidase organizer 1-like n=1 Tax=Solea senegalensis TaxID=28829 RepID=A0AAV6RJ48_SOLSE|nr:NADPH oxidase organizer 1-like [Solea senegalensis]